MKRILATAVLAAMAAGCQLTNVKTPEWEVSLRSHWFKRDVDKFNVTRNADGSYSVDLNGYKSDASEQFPAFTREMWSGLGILGRIAAATVNPTAAAVPLTAEAADAEAIAKLQRELAAAKAEVVKAKAEAKAATASATTSAATATACEGGNCETKQ